MAGTTDAAKVLDHAVLDANTMADAGLQAELFDLFFDHAPKSLGMLVDGLSRGDRQTWRDGAHALKGAAATLGLMRLNALAAQAEDQAPSDDMVARLRLAVQDARAAATAHSDRASEPAVV